MGLFRFIVCCSDRAAHVLATSHRGLDLPMTLRADRNLHLLAIARGNGAILEGLVTCTTGGVLVQRKRDSAGVWVTEKVVLLNSQQRGEKQLARPLALRFPGGPPLTPSSPPSSPTRFARTGRATTTATRAPGAYGIGCLGEGADHASTSSRTAWRRNARSSRAAASLLSRSSQIAWLRSARTSFCVT